MQAGERNVGHAAGEEGHAVPANTVGGKCFADLGKEERRVGRRRELCHVAESAEHPHQAQTARQRLQAADFIQVEQGAGDREQGARLEELAEQERAQPASQAAARNAGFDFGAGLLHHAAVWHAGRAGGFAAAAGQAEADVFEVSRGDRRALGDLHHLIDAAAGRIHLQAQFAVGGAGVQAETTVDTLIQIELVGPGGARFRGDGRVGHGSTGWTDQTEL